MIKQIEVTFGLLVFLLLCGCNEAALALGTTRSELTSLKVGAIQYASGQSSGVLSSCASAAHPDGCAIKELVSQAQQQGAVLVVAPELGLDQQYYEPDPKLGDNPGADPNWPSTAPYLKMFSLQAEQLGLTIVIHLLTKASGVSKPYSTQVALGPDGSVVGKHHKFELFSNEKYSYTAGQDVMVFESALGKVGMLICADIYGDLKLHDKLTSTLKARVVAFSSFWTVAGAANFQQSYAKNWGVYLVGSNVSGGAGKGGGVFDPEGKELARIEQASPSLLIASIPEP